IPPRVPDDQNFAMTPFFAPLFDFEPGTQKQRDTNAVKRIQDFASALAIAPKPYSWAMGKRTDLAQRLAAFQKPTDKPAKSTTTQAAGETDQTKAATAILEKLSEYSVVLDELRAASRRPHCRFNISYDVENPVTILLPHLTVVRGVCNVVQLRALAKLASGQTDSALDDVNFIFYLSDSMKNEPMLISHLVRVSNLDMAVQVIWEELVDRRWSDAQLQALQKRLQSYSLLADYKRAMQGERAGFGNGTIEYLIKASNRDALFSMTSGRSSRVRNMMLGLIPRGWIRMEQLNYNRDFDNMFFPTFDVAAKRAYPKIITTNTETFLDSSTIPLQVILQHRVLVRLFCPALGACLLRFSNAQATIDEAAIACALERYRLANGQFPEKLDALVPRFMATLPHDIITGEPLKYRKNGDGFVLYSVGWNEKDDGGVPDAKGDNSRGDWVWQCPARK
ncbi:MAG: hypothetical protein WC740_15475, partial [Verrucomicrobiia bacterium]